MNVRANVLAVALALAAVACGGGGGGSSGGGRPDEPMPDFHLLDVNPASPTAGLDVSPRDLLGSVSVWYFGHST
jgi:hypothetical protein